ncbi:hypothetical protein BB561_005391 [Smittium simulii]|nr:hypothetical protein BB561_005391 [Smittium simulii]
MNKETKTISGYPSNRKVVANIYTPKQLVEPVQSSKQEIVLLFGHANGFHKELWEPIISLLFLNLPKINTFSHYISKAIAFDFSTQGDSAVLNGNILSNLEKCDWIDYARESHRIVEQFGLSSRNTIAIGHSLGASSFLVAEIIKPSLFKAIIAVEPVLKTAMPKPYFPSPFSGSTIRRKAVFISKKEAFDYYKSKLTYSTWDDQILSLHIDHGLLKKTQNGKDIYTLKCNPKIESLTYDGAFYATKLFEKFPNMIQCPTTIIAGQDSPFS